MINILLGLLVVLGLICIPYYVGLLMLHSLGADKDVKEEEFTIVWLIGFLTFLFLALLHALGQSVISIC